MAKKKGSVWATLGKVFLILFMIVCVAVDGWYIYLKFFAPEKIVSTTNEISDVVLSDGTAKKMIEINYYKNENQNGLEMFEIKFNYLLDESRTAYYSQGVQYVTSSENEYIDWEYYKDLKKNQEFLNRDTMFWLWGEHISWGHWGYVDPTYANTYNYQSHDDYKTTSMSTNPIDKDTMFKITLGEGDDQAIYGMKFKWDNVQMTVNENINNDLLVYQVDHRESDFFDSYRHDYYFSYADLNYFAKCLYDSIQSLTAGTSSPVVFEFSDLFDYYECEDEATGRYSSTSVSSDLLKFDIKNYFGIQVNIHADGAKKASDSMFNCIQGNSTFNIAGDYTTDDYLYGKTVVNCDIYDFDLMHATDNYYTLKLSQDFIDYYAPYVNLISLSVEIDLDIFNAKGFEFLGFSQNSGLENYEIYECYTVETIDDAVVRTEVAV